MMTTSPQILIASVYGRGHWLAVELVRRGFLVKLLDATSFLGKAKTEDQEGPFGFFGSTAWQGKEFEFLQSFGPATEVDSGFSLWLKSGPWEMRTPHSLYRGQALNQKDRVIHFVKHLSEYSVDRKQWIEKLKEWPFDRRWLASLACDLMSNQSHMPFSAIEEKAPTPLFESYYVRYPEIFSLSDSLKWCAQEGVEIVEKAQIPDLAIESRKIQGLEITADKSGFSRCHHLIWMLNSRETAFFSPRVFLKLYKGISLNPEWCWLRYQINFIDSREVQNLPLQFLFLTDLHIPWAHENYVLFRRSILPGQYHVWMKLPYSQRFQSEYLQERIQPLIQQLEQRCPRLKVKEAFIPQEAQMNSQELGPCLFPVFQKKDLIHPPGVTLKNLWYSHSENWPSYSWPSIISHQSKLITKIQDWWASMNSEQKQKELDL